MGSRSWIEEYDLRFTAASCVFLTLAFGCPLFAGPFAPEEGLRRPVAMALSTDQSLLYVANRDSGSVSVLDAGTLKLVDETEVGKRLTDVAWIADSHLLATDAGNHELILLAANGFELEVAQRLQISPYPQKIAVTADGQAAYITSLWSQQLTKINYSPKEKQIRVNETVDLPFAANQMLLIEAEKKLIVADHFAGRFAIVDCQTLKIDGVRKFFAENIRGLGIDPRSKLLAVSHTMLNEYAHTVRNDVHWGVLMSNDLRWLQLPEVLDPKGDFYNKGHMHPLGEPGMGGSDPGELAFFADGMVVVPMAGVNKIAFGKEGDFGMHRLNVGRGPTTVVASDKQHRAFVANTFDDSISVIDMVKKEVAHTVSLGPQRKLTLAEQGEVLFHDGRLAHDGWMTCNTCHTGGHTNGGMNDNFSDKSFGAPKRVLSLLGAKDTAPYAWNGQAGSLEEQIRNSNKLTMHGRAVGDDQVEALAAYVQTLEPPPSIDALRGKQNDKLIKQGEKLFAARDCASCHVPPLYTSEDTYDVGIHDKQGNTHFNPPSLRGVAQRGPYFHNGTAATLADVFTEHGHQLDGKDLSGDELDALLAFLRSL